MKNSFLGLVLSDFKANSRNTKGKIICLLFRTAHELRGKKRKPRLISLPYLIVYRIVVEWFLGVEIPPKTIIGSGMQIFHGTGIVINGDAVLGKNVVIRNGVTIGHKYPNGPTPRLGDNISIGANSVIIGGISIGNNVIIGALALVNQDFSSNKIIAGNPAKVIGELDSPEYP